MPAAWTTDLVVNEEYTYYPEDLYMRGHKLLLTLALSAMAFAAPAFSATYSAVLTGDQEKPTEVITDGTGFSTLTLVGSLLEVQLDFMDLEGLTTDAHIHCCVDPSGATGVAVGFTPAGFPLGVSAGSFNAVFNLDDASIYTMNFLNANGGTAAGAKAALVSAMEVGRAYVNVHSTYSRPGEIRGNISAVPEPATIGLVGLALGGLAVRRRLRAA